MDTTNPKPPTPENAAESACKNALARLMQKRPDFTVVVSSQDLRKLLNDCRTSGCAAAGGEQAVPMMNRRDDDWVAYLREVSNAEDDEKKNFEFSLEIIKGARARFYVCSAHRGEAWSVTVRWEPPSDFHEHEWVARHLNYKPPGGTPKKRDSWAPSGGYDLKGEHGGPFLFSMSELVALTYQCVFDANVSPKQGLILIAGSTASGKSQLAMGLMSEHLAKFEVEGLKRRLHLVTHEDPIEKLYRQRAGSEAIDYTPRQFPADTSSLEATLRGALRQTPAIVYAGEVRGADDLRRCMEFAGTGHLIVATAHAGSLTEAMEKTLRACKAEGPGGRALWAAKIHSVIHMAPFECQCVFNTGDPHAFRGFVPSIYRRTAQGVQSLVADGLASLLPYCAEREALAKGGHGSLSRTALATALCKGADDRQDQIKEALTTTHLFATPQDWVEFRAWHGGNKRPNSISNNPKNRRIIESTWEADLDGR